MGTRMDTKMQVERPGTVTFTLHITMELDDWVKLKTQLETAEHWTSFPAYHLRDRIEDMVKQASASFRPEEPE